MTKSTKPEKGTDEPTNNDEIIQAKLKAISTEIEGWRAKYGKDKLHVVSHNEAIAIFRTPKVIDLERALAASKGKKAKELDFSRVIIRECALHVDDIMAIGIGQDEYQLALLTSVGEIAAIPEATVKKL